MILKRRHWARLPVEVSDPPYVPAALVHEASTLDSISASIRHIYQHQRRQPHDDSVSPDVQMRLVLGAPTGPVFALSKTTCTSNG